MWPSWKRPKKPTVEMVRCPYCGKEFPKSVLPWHKLFCHILNPLSCPICERRFGTVEELREHIQRSHPELAQAVRKLVELARRVSDEEFYSIIGQEHGRIPRVRAPRPV